MTKEQKRIIYELKQLDRRLKMHEIKKEFENTCRWDRLLGFITDDYIKQEARIAVRKYLKRNGGVKNGSCK